MNVLDLGANHGRFRQGLLHRYDGGCYGAAEANPALIAKLRAQGYDWVEHCAVSDRAGSVEFRIAENDAASSVLQLPTESVYDAVQVGTETIASAPLSALIARMSDPIDVLKVDIEGAEVRALASLSDELERVVQLTVEFHSDPSFNFDLVEETHAVIDHISRRGFLALEFEAGLKDVLFLNRTLCKVSRRSEIAYRVMARLRRSRIRLGAMRRRLLARGRTDTGH